LARGPIVERLLFEQPWPLIAGLLFLAVVAFVVLNRRGLVRAGLIVLALGVALGAGVLLLARAVQTPREAMTEATIALVHAAAATDSAALERLLAPDARLFSRFAQPGAAAPEGGLDRPAIIAAARRVLREQWPLKEHSVDEVQAETAGPGSGRTQVRVRVVVEQWQIPYSSWWRVDWQKGPDGAWRAVLIEPLELPGASEGR
jgi:hypothetical protein